MEDDFAHHQHHRQPHGIEHGLSLIHIYVLCEDGRIAAIYKEPANAPKDAQVLDASGCFVCPGFVDPHGHIDGCKRTGMLSLLQGITTTVGGNCGFSPLDTGSFLRSQTEFPIHQAELVGLCALREAAGVTDLFAPARRAQVHTCLLYTSSALRVGDDAFAVRLALPIAERIQTDS